MEDVYPVVKENSRGHNIFSILLVAFPFIAFSVIVVTYRYTSLPYAVTAWVQIITLLCILIGTVTGWMKGFPQWSYPYTIILVYLLAILLAGHDVDMSLAENIFYKSVILSPLALFFFLVWLFARRKVHLRYWFTNIRSQWTLLSFLVYSYLPLAINTIFTDIRSLYGAPFMAASTFFAIVGACLYILFTSEKLRLWALSVCLTLTWACAAMGSSTYWHGRQARWSNEIINGYQLATQYAAFWALMLLLIVIPPLLVWSWRGRKDREVFLP